MKHGGRWRGPSRIQSPYGLTTAEQRHPQFRTHGTGKCRWDGAVWPFATSQTLTAMANYLNGDGAKPISDDARMGVSHTSVICDTVFFDNMQRYVESQYHRGRPYIGEYLDEQTGAWLMGDRERSRYYNHSTFADLVITASWDFVRRPTAKSLFILWVRCNGGTISVSTMCDIMVTASLSFGIRQDRSIIKARD